MRALLITILILTALQTKIYAQSFSRAMELYRAENYREAADLFLDSNDDRALLFAGKSFLNIADYASAIHHLEIASGSMQQNLSQEANYSLALAHFGLQNYDVSLQYLYDLANSNNQTGLRSDAQRFYNQILNYLSIRERYATLYRLRTPAIQFDLVNSSKPFMDAESFKIMVDELVQLTGNRFSPQQIEEELLGNLSTQSGLDQYPAVPEGIVYKVGVTLPVFDEDDPDFVIPRNLYYGMVLAADEFNDRNSNRKIDLIFRNSGVNTDTTASVFSELAWTKKVDAVIGPLFSEPATRMAQLAERYQIPMLAPLANSDSLNLDYNFTYQMNPTFEIHGRKMAQFAVRQLRLDSLAVITEKGSLGRASAIAFRHEAERLGAHISYYIEEDFAATGYDFSDITKVFTPDPQLRDSLNFKPSKAIYAPFTGEASTTMVNLLMNNLEAMDSDLVILGSEEWEHASLTDYQKRFFDIYYSRSFTDNPDTSAFEMFREDYVTRFGTEPDRFSRIGYDTANYLFRSLETSGNPEYLGHAIRNQSLYNGMALHVNFNGRRVNQHVFIRSLSNSESDDQSYR